MDEIKKLVELAPGLGSQINRRNRRQYELQKEDRIYITPTTTVKHF